jgi:hypothetical protein
MSESFPSDEQETSGPTRPAGHVSPIDLATLASIRVLRVTAGTARRAGSVLSPTVRLALEPPFVPARLRPRRWLARMSVEGAELRAELRLRLTRTLDDLLPVVLAEVLRRARLTDLVIEFVDLDRIVSEADLDATVATVDLGKVVDRVEVDAVVAKVDMDAVLERLDLTAIVLQQVDLEAVVTAVLDRIDLVELAAEVIEGVDLPEIIRESTGTMASDTVRGVRMQGIAADEAVGRVVDRLLLRRGSRSTQAPGGAAESPVEVADPDPARRPPGDG